MRGRARILVLAFVCVIFAAPQSPAAPAGRAVADSAEAGTWQALYRSRIFLSERSGSFPWNDPLSEAHVSDRVAVMGLWRPPGGLELFAKGATGTVIERDERPREGFAFEQGHLSYSHADRLGGRLFAYERGLRGLNRLLQLVSNDSPIASTPGEGVDASVRVAGPVSARYTGAAFKADRDGSGLPSPTGGGDFFSIVSLGAEAGSWNAGLMLGDTRSQALGDAVLVGLSCGVPAGPARVVAELARSAAGSWDDLRGEKIFDADFDRMSAGEVSRWLSPNAAAAVEVLGLDIASKRYGRFGMIPGYRYAGERFADAGGEVAAGTVESYLTVWWRHPKLAALLSVNAADRYDASREKNGGVLSATLDTRFRGGVETRGTALLREGYRGVFAFSIIDDTSLSRVSATARLDDAGGESSFSYLTEAAVNIGRRFTLGGTLLLESSARGYYSAGLEMRGGGRFFARASFGSYVPVSEYVRLNYGPSVTAVDGEMYMSLYVRVSLGGM